MIVTKYDVKSLIYGLAVGDAMGVPVEFKSRIELEKAPVKEMLGYGTFNVPYGTWSDDTSMTLCLVESLARTGRIDFNDIMNNFMLWEESAEFTATGDTFDIGNTCATAIHNFSDGIDPMACGGREEVCNGNGSLMRISPMALWLSKHPGKDMDETMEMVHRVSALTHAHPRSKMACGIYILIMLYIIQGRSLNDSIYTGVKHALDYYGRKKEFAREIKKNTFIRIASDTFASFPMSKIKSDGYVVDTLEAVLWCLLNTENYHDCILKAVNLGGDTDTTAAIAGAMAGLAYGYDSIPRGWIDNNKYKNRSLKGKDTWLDPLIEKFSLALAAK